MPGQKRARVPGLVLDVTNWIQDDSKTLDPSPPVTKHLHFGLKSSLYSGPSRLAPSIWNDDAFLAEKARGKAEFRVDLSNIPLTLRRDRVEVIAGIANDEDEKSDTRLRAIKQISDETAADVEGMLAALQEQIDLLERQITGKIVALHR